MCAYGPMVVGYNRAEVECAARDQRARGNCTTGAPAVMVDLAEYLVDLVPAADWAFFAKNGGDVTNYAVMIARDATARSKIVMVRGGYHGVAPWMQTPGHHGLIDEDHRHIIRIPFNDFEALEQVVAAHPGDVAGFIATPYHVPTFADSQMPTEGYWPKVEALCRRHDIVLIVDDIRHGFRLDMGGSNEYFGFQPDLICFCKALANGYPISALVGRTALKDVAARVFYTGSYWFAAVPMAAALANLKLMRAIDAPQRMLAIGRRLCDGLATLAAGYGYELKISGAPSMPYMRITNDPSLMLHQDWCGECTRRGAFFTSHHNWFVSTAHTEDDIRRTLDIADDAFKALKAKYGDEY
jgi:glutamate-1-semialdehyde 2,1-aminomutase